MRGPCQIEVSQVNLVMGALQITRVMDHRVHMKQLQCKACHLAHGMGSSSTESSNFCALTLLVSCPLDHVSRKLLEPSDAMMQDASFTRTSMTAMPFAPWLQQIHWMATFQYQASAWGDMVIPVVVGGGRFGCGSFAVGMLLVYKPIRLFLYLAEKPLWNCRYKPT